jgi:hypothetical protein
MTTLGSRTITGAPVLTFRHAQGRPERSRGMRGVEGYTVSFAVGLRSVEVVTTATNAL